MGKYLLIAIAVLSLALGGVTKLYLWKVEELGALEVQYEHQRGETAKAIAQIEGLKATHLEQIAKFDLLQEWKGQDNARYQKDLRRLQDQRKTTQEAAQKYPKRFGRIATFNLRRSLREFCRAGGGSATDCKIEIPKPAAPVSTVSNKSDDQDARGIGGPN